MKPNPVKYKYLFPASIFKNSWRALFILVVGLCLTALATFYAQRKVESDAKQEFALNCNEIKIKTVNRLRTCAQLLQTGSAFFAASDTVTCEQWRLFNQNSKYEKILPGIKGLGYSMLVTNNQLKQYITNVRKEGFPNYKIWPEVENELYTPVIYIEPFVGRNRLVPGYNGFSDSTRRKAMEISRDSDFATLSGKVILVQNEENDRQSGVVMFVPVYHKGMAVKTVEQRRAAIKGWVYSSYHLNDLILGTLGHWDLKTPNRIRLQIFEEQISNSSLIYDSQENENSNIKYPTSRTLTLQVNPCLKKWVLQFSQSDPHYFFFQKLVAIVFLTGIFISILLFLLSFSLFYTRDNAQRIADELTAELKESELRIREVLENSLDASYKRNLITHSYDYLSPAYSRISGYPADQMRTMPLNAIIELMHPDDVPEVNRIITLSLTETLVTTYQMEYRFRHKEGSYRWFHDKYTVVRNLQGEPEALIGSVSDITDRKQVEETLRNERLLLRTLIDNIPDSIYCMDIECRKTLANSTDLHYMRAESEAEVIGKNDFDFYPKEIAEKFFEVDNSVIQSGKPLLNIEESLIDINGETRWLLTSKIPMFNNQGKIIGLLGYGRDITERKLAEEEIKIKNQQLLSLNASKDKLFSIIAHDLRSPFNGFLGLTQIMAEDLSTLTLDEIREMAESIRNSAATLYRLLENLLQWSTLQQGRMVFNPVILPLKSTISESMAIAKLSAHAKEIKIQCLIPDELEVYADVKMVQTIIRNLLSNSVKFTKKGGAVTISAQAIDENMTEISIKDTGIGMSQTILKGLFQMDINTSRKGTDGETSTGLGLLICNDFVEKNGGKLRVKSEVGIGSTFYFTLPNKLSV